jgi:hypothetical protein
VVIVVRRRQAGLEQLLASVAIAQLPDDPRRTLWGFTRSTAGASGATARAASSHRNPLAQAAGVVPEATLERRGKAEHRLVAVGFPRPGERRPDVRAEHLAHYQTVQERMEVKHGERLMLADTPEFAEYATLRRGIGFETECLAWCRWMIERLEHHQNQG